MAYNLGTARGIIEILYNPRGVRDATRDLNNLGDQSTSNSKKMQSAGNIMGAAGGLVAAGLLVAVNQAAKFEKAVDGVAAVAGSGAAEIDKIREKALKLGETTAFGATESADAMAELVKAGLSVEEVLNGAADATVALAAAGDITLAKAAIIAANAMNQFGRKAEEMPKIADKIAGAANASAISVHQFGLSLSQVGAVANLVGFSFEDTATAIAVLGDAGIRGSDAGTSLKTMFINLVPQTKPAIALFDKLGLSQFSTARAMELLRSNGIKPLGKDMGTLNDQIVALSVKQSGAKVGTAKQTKAYAILTSQMGVMANQFFDAQGKVKPMEQVFGVLAEAMKDLSKEQQIATLSTIFGTDAIRASAIATAIGAGGFKKMSEEMSKVTAAEVAAARLNNLKGDIEKLKSTAETMAINLGTVLIPALRDLAQSVTDLIAKFNQLSPETQKNVVMAAVWTSGILLTMAAIVGLVRLITAFVGVVKAAAAGIRFLTAVIRLNGGMALFMARSWLTAQLAAARLAISAAAARVSILATAAATRIAAAASAVWTAVTTALSLANLRAAASWVASTAAMVAYRAGLVVGTVLTYGMAAAQAALTAIMALNPFTLVVIAIVALVAALVLAYKKSETFRAIVDAVWKHIKLFITTAITQIKTVVVAVWNFLATAFKVYFNIYKTVVMAVFNYIKNFITNTIAVVRAVITIGLAYIRSRWEAVKQLATIVSTAFNNIVSAIRARIAAVIAAVTSIVTGIVTRIRGLRDSLVSAGRDAIQGLINGITGMFGTVMNKARELADSVKNTIKNALKISSPSRIMMELGVEIPNGLIAGMERMHGQLRRAAGDLANVPIGAITNPVGAFSPALTTPAGGGVSYGPGVVFEKGAVTVVAPAGMNAAQVGEFTARRLGTSLSTRTQSPRVAVSA